jgi:hypothetical protein
MSGLPNQVGATLHPTSHRRVLYTIAIPIDARQRTLQAGVLTIRLNIVNSQMGLIERSGIGCFAERGQWAAMG